MAGEIFGAQFVSEGEKMANAQLAQLANKKPEIGWVPGVMWAGIADLSRIPCSMGLTRRQSSNLGIRFIAC